MRSLPSPRFLSVAACAALIASSSDGLAQRAPLSLDRFDPAPAGDRMFGVQSPFVAGDLTPHVMLLADYAHNPLVLRSSQTDATLGNVVSNQFFLHGNVSLALWDRLNINVDLPIALYQNGGSPTVGGQGFPSPGNAEVGDLRLGLRVLLLGSYADPFQLAVGGYVWAPTGNSSGFVGTGNAHGMPQLILGGLIEERVHWSVAGGPDIQGNQTFGGVDQGTMIKWGAGVGVLLLDDRHLQIGAETSGATTVQNAQKHTLNAEMMGTVRYRIVDDVEIGAGAGPGLTSGIGTPDVRGVFTVAYTPERQVDTDGDGIIDRLDACPREPGVKSDDPKKNGCPLRDRDKDGIFDDDDACPDEPGVKSSDPKKNGCPLRDRDKDGIFDDDDACPDVKGVADPDPKKNGCPKDTDGDGILDDDDACPEEKGVPDPDPKKNGCPKAVRVVDQEIIILEQVQFDTGKATIKKVSDPLLNEVAAVLKEHPDILRIEVQGHTDNRGSKAGNKVLSQQRADSVQKALLTRGIASSRLSAKGFGQEVPIDDNKTDAGRQKNRRVQFKILERRAKEKP